MLLRVTRGDRRPPVRPVRAQHALTLVEKVDLGGREKGLGGLSIAENEKSGHPLEPPIERRVVDLAMRRANGRRVPKDRLIGDLASRQYGVVSRVQLLSMGIGAGAIKTRLRKQYLHRLHRGVYAVGHLALIPLAREMAAVLACGQASAVSHRSAAVVWHLLPARDDDEIDVTVPALGRGAGRGSASTGRGTFHRKMSGISADSP